MRRSEPDADGHLQPNPLADGPPAPLAAALSYASLTLAGRAAPVVVLKARGEELAPALLEALDRDLALDDPTQVLSYQDSRKDVAKRAWSKAIPSPRCASPAKPRPPNGWPT
jgi:hypothetical protein